MFRILVSIIWCQTISCYYLTPNHLLFSQADQYCQNHCGSHLASVHNIAQNNEMIATIKFGHSLVADVAAIEVFFGLYDDGNYLNFTWKDTTPFNYGYTFNQYPWAADQPDSQTATNCGQIWVGNNYTWDDTSCASERRALCNSCSGKLNKYISLRNIYDYDNAKAQCEMEIGTTLASMHSLRDYNEMRNLCQLFDNDCWIGLNDRDIEGTWVYEDGSTFDYASGSGLGYMPWGTGRPDANSVNDDVVELQRSGDYWLNDDNSSNYAYPICNMPSELCISVATFTVSNGDFNFYSCQAVSTYSNIKNDAVISDRIYLNDAGVVLVEYLYKMDEIINGRGGIFIPITACTAYYIGISLIANNKLFIEHVKYDDNKLFTFNFGTDLTFNFDETVYYLLSVQIEPAPQAGRIKVTVKVNNQNDMTFEFQSLLNLYSLTVGIWSENTTTYGKSLYVSGTSMKANNADMLSRDNCTVTTTTNPTYFPSKYPSVAPSNIPTISTISPTLNPTFLPTDYGVIIKYGVVITVTFDYKFGVNDTETIVKIIKDVTSKLINDTVTANCIESKDLNIRSVTKGDKTIVNATIFVCDQDTQNQLLTAFDSSNITAEIITDIQKQTGLQIYPNDIALDKDIIIVYEKAFIQSTLTTAEQEEKHEHRNESNVELTIIMVIFIVITLTIAVLYGIYIYRKKKGKYEIKETDMQGNELTKVASISQHMTTDDLDMKTEIEEDGIYGPGSNVTKGELDNDNGTNSESELYEDVKTPQIRTDDGESIYGQNLKMKESNDNHSDDEKMYENLDIENETPQIPENPTSGLEGV